MIQRQVEHEKIQKHTLKAHTIAVNTDYITTRCAALMANMTYKFKITFISLDLLASLYNFEFSDGNTFTMLKDRTACHSAVMALFLSDHYIILWPWSVFFWPQIWSVSYTGRGWHSHQFYAPKSFSFYNYGQRRHKCTDVNIYIYRQTDRQTDRQGQCTMWSPRGKSRIEFVLQTSDV